MSLALSRGLDPQSAARNFAPVVDRSFVKRRLLRNVTTLISAHPRAECHGADKLLENLSYAQGFTDNDLAIVRISIGLRRHTLVCVPEGVWRTRKTNLIELKRVANFVGRSCTLVPEIAIQRQPRLSTARAIEEACGVSVSVDHRMAVLVHMVECGGVSTFMDCACALHHPQPFAAIMHMVAI